MIAKDKLHELLSKCMLDDLSDKNNILVGSGITTGYKIAFNKRKVEETKPIIAKILDEIGIVNMPLISLELLTKDKNGEKWNNLENIDDFKTLDLLLAFSDAASFILNNVLVQQMNVNQIGEISSIAISYNGRNEIGDDTKWLKLIRSFTDKMFFITNPDELHKYLDDEIIDENITPSTK